MIPGALTNAHITEAVVETIRYTPKKAFETIEILLELSKRSLESGENVLISGFGKFCVKKKRQGRNQATGEDLTLKPRKVAAFLNARKN